MFFLFEKKKMSFKGSGGKLRVEDVLEDLA